MPGLRVALIGCGSVGRVHLARWLGLSGVELVSVCDVDAATTSRVATEFGVEGHTDWRGVLDGRPDIVDICAPPHLHHAMASAALKAGAHVLCETPMGRGADEARALVDLAAASGRVLMPVFCHRFSSQVLFVRELLENDDLGTIVMFRSRLSGLFPEMRDRWTNDRDIDPTGVLQDTTIHSIDLFRHLVGEIASATGMVATFGAGFQVPDTAVMTLQGAEGELGTVESSWATPGGRNVLEVYGTAGACVVDYDTGHVRFRTADMVVWETRDISGPDRFLRLQGHFTDVIRGLQPPQITPEEAVKAHEILAVVREG